MTNEKINVTNENEKVEIMVFNKDAMQEDLSSGLNDFGRGCCDAGKKALAPLAQKMACHFFNWLSDMLQ